MRVHHQELLLAGNEHHVAADCLAKIAFSQERFCEAVEVSDFLVINVGKFIDWQKALLSIKSKMPGVVVCKIKGAVAVADNEKLEKAKKRLGITVAWIVLVIDNLLHRSLGTDAKSFQFDLDAGNPIDQEYDVVAVVAIVRINTQLIDHLEGVFARVLDVNQRVVERRTVIAGKTVALAKGTGSSEDIRRSDLV